MPLCNGECLLLHTWLSVHPAGIIIDFCWEFVYVVICSDELYYIKDERSYNVVEFFIKVPLKLSWSSYVIFFKINGETDPCVMNYNHGTCISSLSHEI